MEPWSKSNGNFDLDVTLWRDEDFAPKWFLEKEYSEGPYMLTEEVWFADRSEAGADDAAALMNDEIIETSMHSETFVRENQEKVRAELVEINNRNFRHHNFISECFRQLKKEQEQQSKDISWTVHIDANEFLVPNPALATYTAEEYNGNNDYAYGLKRKDYLALLLPPAPTAGSLWRFYNRFFNLSEPKRACTMMPRLLFGSKEAEDDQKKTTSKSSSTSVSWDHKKFETLRYKYHVSVQFQCIVQVRSCTESKLSFSSDESQSRV